MNFSYAGTGVSQIGEEQVISKQKRRFKEKLEILINFRELD